MNTAAPVALSILLLCLGHIFSNAARTLPAVAVDVLTRDLGLTAEGLAQITSIFPLAFAAVMIPVGIALDRYGVKRLNLLLVTVAGSGAVMASFATGPWSMALAQAVLGAGCSGMLMCPITFAARSLTTPRFAVWSGIIQAVGNTGMLLSASPLALLIEVADWRAGFLACAGIALLALPLVALLVPADAPQAAPRRAIGVELREIAGLAWSPGIRGVLVFVFCSFAAMLGVRGLWGGPWLMETKGLDRIAAGNVLLACTIALTIGPALAGVVLRRIGHAPALLVGSHLVSAVLIGLIVAGGPGGVLSDALGVPMLPVAWDLVLLVAFGLIISFQVLAFSLMRSAVPPAQTGRALSCGNLSFFLGAAVMQGLSGVVGGWGGNGAALLTFAVALVVFPLGFWWLHPRR